VFIFIIKGGYQVQSPQQMPNQLAQQMAQMQQQQQQQQQAQRKVFFFIRVKSKLTRS